MMDFGSGDGRKEDQIGLYPLDRVDPSNAAVLKANQAMQMSSSTIATMLDLSQTESLNVEGIDFLSPDDHIKMGFNVLPETKEPKAQDCPQQTFCDIANMSEEWYAYEHPQRNGCPFTRLHHSGLPTEFLRHHLSDTRSQGIIAGLNDLSSDVSAKVRFIVSNLKDCLGIWPQLFLQNLISILVHGDQTTIRAVLHKDKFLVMRKLSSYYAKETKCCMIFRYWCLMYNAFSKNLVQVLPTDIKSQLLAQLQMDFSLATQNSCRCKLNTQCNCRCELDDEHRKIGTVEQIKVTSILMYYLVCKIGNHSSNTNNVFDEVCPQPNPDGFIQSSFVQAFIKLHENSKAMTNVDKKTEDWNGMELLSHLLMAYNAVPFNKNVFCSAIQAMLDVGCLSSAMIVKDTLLNVLQKECDVIQKGPGNRLLFIVPSIQICFTTLGLQGVMKAIHNLLTGIEYDILQRNELVHVMGLIVRSQKYLNETGLWNSEYENMYLYSIQLQNSIEMKMGYHVTDIKLDSEDSEVEFGSKICFNVQPKISSSQESHSGSSQTSQSRLTPVSRETGNENEWINQRIAKIRKGYDYNVNKKNIRTRLRDWVSAVANNIIKCAMFCCGCVQNHDEEFV